MACDAACLVPELDRERQADLSLDGAQPVHSVSNHTDFYENKRLTSRSYISDEGAQELKPLFIAMGAVSVISFDLGFILERWLRHKGRLVENTSNWQKLFNICSGLFGIIGAAGLILLAIFDTLRHERLHRYFLIMFMQVTP